MKVLTWVGSEAMLRFFLLYLTSSRLKLFVTPFHEEPVLPCLRRQDADECHIVAFSQRFRSARLVESIDTFPGSEVSRIRDAFGGRSAISSKPDSAVRASALGALYGWGPTFVIDAGKLSRIAPRLRRYFSHIPAHFEFGREFLRELDNSMIQIRKTTFYAVGHQHSCHLVTKECTRQSRLRLGCNSQRLNGMGRPCYWRRPQKRYGRILKGQRTKSSE
jgi:hypothetical protein